MKTMDANDEIKDANDEIKDANDEIKDASDDHPLVTLPVDMLDALVDVIVRAPQDE